MNLRDSKRIIIIGSAGGGKSTLARQLGEITGIPVTHLDNEFGVYQVGPEFSEDRANKDKLID